MMIGESLQLHRSNPTVEIPPTQWDPFTNVNTNHPSPHFLESLTALQRYLPSNESDSLSDDLDLHVDLFSCDEFRMYEFKVRRCARARSHDWTDCPFAHPGEKARRRDPLRYHYSGTACPDYRKGGCKKGDSCEFAHGVFECWLHPTRYRTQPCKDGTACRRRVCFFAHTPEQLRVLPGYNPKEFGPNSCDFDFESTPVKNRVGPFLSSPTSILASPPLSPPMDSPLMSPNLPHSMGDLVAYMRGLHVGKSKIRLDRPNSFNMQNDSGFGSPHGFGSFSPPSRRAAGSGSVRGRLDFCDATYHEEPAMERVESGRDLRTKMYQKLCKENSLNQPAPDVDWISELVL